MQIQIKNSLVRYFTFFLICSFFSDTALAEKVVRVKSKEVTIKGIKRDSFPVKGESVSVKFKNQRLRCRVLSVQKSKKMISLDRKCFRGALPKRGQEVQLVVGPQAVRDRVKKWEIQPYLGWGADGPQGTGYITSVQLGPVYGVSMGYHLNRRWLVETGFQYNETRGTGQGTGSASTTILLTTLEGTFDYDITGTVKTIKIPLKINYKWRKNWRFFAGAYVDLIQDIFATGNVTVKSVSGSGVVVILNESQTLSQDLKPFANSMTYGMGGGMKYFWDRWGFSLEFGQGLQDSFHSAIVIDQVKLGTVLGVDFIATDVALEKSTAKNIFAQAGLSYSF